MLSLGLVGKKEQHSSPDVKKKICTCNEGRPFFYQDKSSVSSLKSSDMCNSFLNSAARLLEVSAADVVR